jgi:transposase
MRGLDRKTGKLFSYASRQSQVPHNHPLRAIRLLVNAALERLSPAFRAIYAADGRPSIAPQRLLRALLLQAVFSVRSERLLMQQIMLLRWFVGLAMDVAVWDVTVFTKNRDRLLEGDIACGFLTAILADPAGQAAAIDRAFLGGRHVDRSLGSTKNFRPARIRATLRRPFVRELSRRWFSGLPLAAWRPPQMKRSRDQQA